MASPSASRATLPGFLFIAAPLTGGLPRFGMRPARSRPALADALRRERLALRGAVALPKWARSSPQLALADQVAFNEQLAQLLSRGVPLIDTLDVAASTVTASAKPIVERLRELVSGGSSFAQAAEQVGVFDEVTVAVYRASERTGDLATAARQLSSTARRMLANRGKAATLMIYPIAVMGIAIIIAFGMITFLVPMIGNQLRDGIGSLPWLTEVMVAIGEFLQAWLPVIALLVGAAVCAAIIFRAVILARLGTFLGRAPLIRDVVLAQELARFFATMAAMTRAGVPLTDALATANQAISQPRLRSQMDRLRSRLVEGGVLRVLIDQVDALPLPTRKLLIAAERSGDLEGAFTSLAGDMTDEVERRSARLIAILQPAIIVVMFIVVGAILMAILIPMLQLPSGFAAAR